MGKRSEQTPHQRRDRDGRQGYAKMLYAVSFENHKLNQQ